MITLAFLLLATAMFLGLIAKAWEDEALPVPLALKASWFGCVLGAVALVVAR